MRSSWRCTNVSPMEGCRSFVIWHMKDETGEWIVDSCFFFVVNANNYTTTPWHGGIQWNWTVLTVWAVTVSAESRIPRPKRACSGWLNAGWCLSVSSVSQTRVKNVGTICFRWRPFLCSEILGSRAQSPLCFWLCFVLEFSLTISDDGK